MTFGNYESTVVAFNALLASCKEFSFLRLGDGETQWMVAVQSNETAPWYEYHDQKNLSLGGAVGTRGLELKHYRRFMDSLEKCTYLDFCEGVSEANRQNLAKIELHRDPTLARNPSPDVSNIVFAWAHASFKDYVSTRRCLFASAEAGMHKELFADPKYRELAKPYFPDRCEVHFHQIRNDGRNYSENLDLIKEDLRAEIHQKKIDTLFLSLATGAKILCYELAAEENIHAIDWGAMSRGLIYCGSPGYHAMRSDHTPFFVRVPFEVYMEAFERAYPNSPPAVRLLKAHSQLMLELQRKKYLQTSPADVNVGGASDLSPENLRAFWQGLGVYDSKYAPLAKQCPEAAKLHADFVLWRRKLGLGIDGWFFQKLVKTKQLLRRITMQSR